MNGDVLLPDDLNIDYVLNQCSDFKYEPHLLKKEVEERGHILLESVVCSPEFAGGGIEYAWGFYKYNQRDANARIGTAKDWTSFTDRIKKMVEDPTILTLERAWKFQRRARDYIRLYLKYYREGETSLTFHDIERIRSQAKTHRNVGEGADARFIQYL